MSLLRNQSVNLTKPTSASSSAKKAHREDQSVSDLSSPRAKAEASSQPEGNPHPLTPATGSRYPASLAVIPADSQRPPSNDGFEDLEAGYGAFPMVKLDGGDVYRIDGEILGTEFQVRMIRVRYIFLWKGRDPRDDGIPRLVWSYDNLTTTREENLSDILRVWRAEGDEPIPRKYAEVMAEIQDGVWSSGNPPIFGVSQK